MSFEETVAVSRDVAFLSLLLVVTLISLALSWKVWALVGSGKRIAKNTEVAVSGLSTRFMGHAGKDLDLASSAGKAASLILWPTRSRRRLELTGLAGLVAVAWAGNWFGIRGGTESGGSFETSGDDASIPVSNDG